jgi:hypothetical protein
MRRNNASGEAGFTIGEMMVTVAIGSAMLGAVLTASVALQKSFAAVDTYFATHMQQIRIIDYLGRDVKRSYSVVVSPDQQTVACTVPNYVIQSGDSDAGAGDANVGKRRTPVVTPTVNGAQVDYGRTVLDAAVTYNSTTLTSATAAFKSQDVGQSIAGDGIPAGTTIAAVVNGTTITMSKPADYTGTSKTATVSTASSVTYAVNGDTIVRTENGSVTMIASSTHQLIPSTTDVELANTEYALSAVTFLPTFNFNPKAVQNANSNSRVAGTAVYAKSYLRNKRRN